MSIRRVSLLAVCVGLLGPLTASAGTPDPAPLPDIDAFMQIVSSGSPSLSRDGTILHFTSNASGVNQVYRLDRTTGWPYQLTVFADGVDFYELSPAGDRLVCGVSKGGDENAQLWLLDPRTGQGRVLTDRPEVKYGSPSWTSDGRTIFYSSNEANGKDFFIYRMDLDTGESALVADLPGSNSPAGVSPDDRYLLVGHTDSAENSDLHLVELASGARTLLTPHAGSSVFDGGQFDAAGTSVFVASNATPDGVMRRAVINRATLERTFFDTRSTWDVEAVGLSRRRDLLGWTVNEDGYSRLHLMDLVHDRMLPAPPLDGQIEGFSFSDDGAVAVGFSSATRTGDIWIWDPGKPELVQATHSTYAGVDPARFVTPRLVRFRTFDRREIPAFLYLPPGYVEGKPVPFIVHVHGGPESQFRPSFVRHFQYLLLHGYGILAPNVRGSSGYGKEYLGLDNYRKRLDSVKDLKAAADFLVGENYSAPGLLAVKGGSYGGYMTLAAITEYPETFSAAADEVGIANFVTFLEKTAAYRRALREAEYGPLTDRAFLDSISPLGKASLIKTPLLVVHGENDPRVPVGEARQIVAAIQAEGGEVDSLFFPDEGHGVAKRANILVMYRKMVAFLDAHLKHGTDGSGGSD